MKDVYKVWQNTNYGKPRQRAITTNRYKALDLLEKLQEQGLDVYLEEEIA